MLAGPIRHVLSPEFIDFLWARDFVLYRDATARFFEGGPYYLPEQLTGPYELAYGHVLYPPPSVLLFAPFMVLPALLWWLIPIGITAAVILRLRPASWTWPLILLGDRLPITIVKVAGNPVIWVVAVMALGRLVAWPSILALLKPFLFPFAFIGIRHRSWWVARPCGGARPARRGPRGAPCCPSTRPGSSTSRDASAWSPRTTRSRRSRRSPPPTGLAGW